MTPIFILGVSQRSGTNFVYRALLTHPDCAKSAAPPEDYLVSNFQHLTNFFDRVSNRWNPKWDVGIRNDFIASLRRETGAAILRALAPSSNGRALVTKTPSPVGLEHFRAILPEAKLVVVVRDGRDVVASGMRGGFWGFEEGVRGWASSAAKIVQFVDRHGWEGPDHIVIRYEDVVESPGQVLPKVLEVCGLDNALYPYDQLVDLPIFGSSYSSQNGEYAWQERPPAADFSPVGRHADLNAAELAQYEWLCGDYHRGLGYELPAVPRTINENALNRLRDLRWGLNFVRQEMRRLARASVRRMRPSP